MMAKKKSKQLKKRMRRDALQVPPAIQAEVTDALRSAFTVLDDVDGRTVPELEKVLRVGRKVVGANPQGRPRMVSDDDLVKMWCTWRLSAPGWTVVAVSQWVRDELARHGVELSVDRITKRVRDVLTDRRQWNAGAGPS